MLESVQANATQWEKQRLEAKLARRHMAEEGNKLQHQLSVLLMPVKVEKIYLNSPFSIRKCQRSGQRSLLYSVYIR